ncbi:MAG: ATP-binding cassette domain-containing protein [Clostridiales Family XIII bacterium]|nr:ATP-binding cassette domain-containing protein [Clostridiales Family XIII bacterium]
MGFLEVENITKKFGRQTALDDINVSIERGELVCILGPSGCGKTTLIRIIAGLETADGGRIYMDGRDCTELPASKRNLGIVFQSYALFPNMTVHGNIMFGLRQKKELPRDEANAKALEVLRLVDLLEHKDKYPRQLSGGQQQRTALARAIALSPDYLLLDEPLSALDAKVRVKLRGEIRKIQRALSVTTVMVTHDQEEALTMADRIIVMNNAVVEQIGTPREIYNHPATPFVANFIGMMNFYEREGEVCAIRPENIALADRRDVYDASAKIQSLEFKGPLTRIHGILPGAEEIFVDISSEAVDNLSLRENSMIFLRMPEDNVMKYSEGSLI